MNDDIWYNILLQSNVEDLQNYCLTNTNAKNVCYNKQFWLEKTFLHNVPDYVLNLPKTPSDWIRLLQINKEIEILLNIILSKPEYEDNLTIITNSVGKISSQLIFSDADYDLNYVGFYKHDNKYYLEIYSDNMDNLYREETDLYDIKNLLHVLMYFYPHYEIADEREYSFLYKNLKNQIENYKNQIDNYIIPEEFKASLLRKYEQLKNRLELISHLHI